MSPCGCTATCGCNVIAGAGIHVLSSNGTFTITATGTVIGAPTFISETDPGDLGYSYVWIEVDEDGIEIETHIVYVAP